MSASEYLEAEHIAEFKSEYMYGQVFAMSGASPSHASIVASATAALGPLVKRRGSTYYSSDLKVGIEGSVYCYPDLTVVCGKPEFVSPGKDVLANPTVIVEVLSPSTEAYDRGAKFHAYRQIESLQHYVLISQSSPTVDLISRRDAVWVIETTSGEGNLALASLDITVSLGEIYDQVTFSE
jgi:Uma2 family endonuclease